jgi:hypothetical protein
MFLAVEGSEAMKKIRDYQGDSMYLPHCVNCRGCGYDICNSKSNYGCYRPFRVIYVWKDTRNAQAPIVRWAEEIYG